MRILIYEPMPDIRQADVWLRLAAEYANKGHEVFILVDEEVQLLNRNDILTPHTLSCLNIVRWKLAGSGVPFYAVPRQKVLRKQFSRDPSETTLAEIDDYRGQHYRKVLEAYRPDRILVWNGLKRYQARFLDIVRAEFPSIEVRYLEAGWFPQAGTYYEDPMGVNAASSIAMTTPPPLSAREDKEIEQWKSAYRKRNGDYPISDGGYYFVPLQLETDSNITKFSPFATMEPFVHWVIENTPPGAKIVVRSHPLNPNTRRIANTVKSNVSVDNETPLHKLIAESRAVIGINSTVLLESMVYEKPVYALGQGLFQSSNAINLQSIESPIQTSPRTDTEAQNELLYKLTKLQRDIPPSKPYKKAPLGNATQSPPTTQYGFISRQLSKAKVRTRQLQLRLSQNG